MSLPLPKAVVVESMGQSQTLKNARSTEEAQTADLAFRLGEVRVVLIGDCYRRQGFWMKKADGVIGRRKPTSSKTEETSR